MLRNPCEKLLCIQTHHVFLKLYYLSTSWNAMQDAMSMNRTEDSHW